MHFRRVLRGVAIAFCFLAVLGVISIAGRWHISAYLAKWQGKCLACTYAEANEAARSSSAQHQSYVGERENVAVIATDGDLSHFSSSLGTFWAPKGTDVAFLVAEQLDGVYGPIVKDGVVLDCGANIGTFTRLALRQGAAKVIAIEPVEGNVRSLERNFQDEIKSGRVVVYPKGVWNREEILEMKEYDNSALDTFVLQQRSESASAPRITRLPVTKIDQIVTKLGLERVDMIKMDVEGAEVKALHGSAETLQRFRPKLAIATENQASDVHDVPQTVREIHDGYRLRFGTPSLQSDNAVRPTVAFFQTDSE